MVEVKLHNVYGTEGMVMHIISGSMTLGCQAARRRSMPYEANWMLVAGM
jgi:hypothetical protein